MLVFRVVTPCRPVGRYRRFFLAYFPKMKVGLCMYVVLSCVGRGLCEELILHPVDSENQKGHWRNILPSSSVVKVEAEWKG
jgi:hypothetical protein